MVSTTDSNVLSAPAFSDSITVIRSMLETSAHLASGDSDDLALSLNLTLRALVEITSIEGEIKTIASKLSNENQCALLDGAPPLNDRIYLGRENTSIGDTIRDLRKSQQLTQKQIAESIGVTPGAVTQWELGATEPSWKYILPLSNALKCDPLWLLTGNNPETTE